MAFGLGRMLAGILEQIIEDRSTIVERNKGVAFLTATRAIYQLEELFYFSVNISRFDSGSYVHCAFGGDFASQAITPKAIPAERLAALDIVKLARSSSAKDDACPRAERLLSAMELTPRSSEFAFFGFSRDKRDSEPVSEEQLSSSELKILGDYFHCHMLRRNGLDTSDALVVSARELDCLRWVAAGKSAWESSVILGISERTVRFHLNSAREKLNCTTTTQAVAKVVAQQLIAV